MEDRRLIDLLESDLEKLIERKVLEIMAKELDHSHNDKSDELLTIDEAAAMFRISKPTLKKYRDNGEIPFRRLVHRIYFMKSELLDSLQSNKKYMRIK